MPGQDLLDQRRGWLSFNHLMRTSATLVLQIVTGFIFMATTTTVANLPRVGTCSGATGAILSRATPTA